MFDSSPFPLEHHSGYVCHAPGRLPQPWLVGHPKTGGLRHGLSQHPPHVDVSAPAGSESSHRLGCGRCRKGSLVLCAPWAGNSLRTSRTHVDFPRPRCHEEPTSLLITPLGHFSRIHLRGSAQQLKFLAESEPLRMHSVPKLTLRAWNSFDKESQWTGWWLRASVRAVTSGLLIYLNGI